MKLSTWSMEFGILIFAGFSVSNISTMKASRRRKSLSVTLDLLEVLEAIFLFFLIGLTKLLDDTKGQEEGFFSKTFLALTVPFGSLCVGQSKYFLNAGSALSTN